MAKDPSPNPPSATGPGGVHFFFPRASFDGGLQGLLLSALWTVLATVAGIVTFAFADMVLGPSQGGGGYIALDFRNQCLSLGSGLVVFLVGQVAHLFRVQSVRRGKVTRSWLAGLWVGALLWNLTGVAAAALYTQYEEVERHGPEPKYTREGKAALNRDMEALRLRLDQGLDPNAPAGWEGRNREPRYLLGLCMKSNGFENRKLQDEMIGLLLERGADPNKPHFKDGEGLEIPIFWVAARAGELERVKIMASHGARLDLHLGNEGNVLNQAARGSHWEVVDWLLGQGCDPLVEDEIGPPLGGGSLTHFGGWTVLEYAAWDGRVQVVERLLASGVQPEPRKKGNSALIAAAYRHEVPVLKRLLTAGADPSWRSDEGTALDQAVAGFGHFHQEEGQPSETKPPRKGTTTVDLLLKQGAKVDEDLMAHALQSGWKALVLRLMKAGGSLDWLLPDGHRALTGRISKEELAWLLDHGANPNLKDGYGATPLSLAEAEYEHPNSFCPEDTQQYQLEMIKLLKAKGALALPKHNPVAKPDHAIKLENKELEFKWGVEGMDHPVAALAWDQTTGGIWSLDESGNLVWWKRGQGGHLKGELGTLRCATIDPVQGWVLVGEEGGHLRLHELNTCRQRWRVRVHGSRVHRVLLDAARGRIYSGGWQTLSVTDLNTGRCLASRSGSGTWLVLDPANSELVTNRHRLDPATLALKGFLWNGETNNAGVASVIFFRERMAKALYGGTTYVNADGIDSPPEGIWIVEPGGVTRTVLTGLSSRIEAMVTDQDGRVLAAAGRKVGVWDLRDNRSVGTYSSETLTREPILAMDGDGQYLAVGVAGGFHVLNLRVGVPSGN